LALNIAVAHWFLLGTEEAYGMDEERLLEGGCACGAVRFRARGAPRRVSLCHCLTCRKAHSSAFFPCVIYDEGQVEIRGELKSWVSPPGGDRQFCPNCGSRICSRSGDEIELSLGSFDETGLFEPEYELWVIRREPWLAPLDVPQYAGDRPPPAAE
jgi:hypothetical protein